MIVIMCMYLTNSFSYIQNMLYNTQHNPKVQIIFTYKKNILTYNLLGLTKNPLKMVKTFETGNK